MIISEIFKYSVLFDIEVGSKSGEMQLSFCDRFRDL